jgi:hypothetical protein
VFWYLDRACQLERATMLRGGWKFVQKKRELHLHINQHCLCGLSMRSMRGLRVQSDAMPAFCRGAREVSVGLRRVPRCSWSEGSMPRCSCQVVSFYFSQQKRTFFCAVVPAARAPDRENETTTHRTHRAHRAHMHTHPWTHVCIHILGLTKRQTPDVPCPH